jgi:nitroreductase
MQKRGFLELARKRRTTFEYLDTPISKKDLATILEAGRLSPSPLNAQPWHFVIVRNKNRIKEIVKTLVYGFFYGEPSAVLCVVVPAKAVSDIHRGVKFGRTGLHDAYLSVGTALISMTLAATDLDIGSAITTPEEKRIRKIIGTNKKDYVPAIILLGYEKKNAHKRKKTRKALKAIISYERYR